jgi:hypothetical protein
MRYFNLIYVLLCFCTSNCLFSQKIERLEKVTPEDFSRKNTFPIYFLHQSSLIVFPFTEDIFEPGAKDKQFDMSIETLMRFSICKTKSESKIVLCSNIYSVKLNFKSINIYSLHNQTVKTEKIKNSEIQIFENDSSIFADFSNIVKDSLNIIDLNYSLITKKKQDIIVSKTKNAGYENFLIRIDIPEIYTYRNLHLDSCLNEKIANKNGQIMGYETSLSNSSLTAKFWADLNKKNNPSLIYRPVMFQIKSIVYNLNNDCIKSFEESKQDIIKLKLSRITEIK